jgi:hypothetical protein
MTAPSEAESFFNSLAGDEIIIPSSTFGPGTSSETSARRSWFTLKFTLSYLYVLNPRASTSRR